MLTPENYSEHHQPYVDSLGMLSPDFYAPQVTHEQYFRYELLPPFSVGEAIVRAREFEHQGYRAIGGVTCAATNQFGESLTLSDALRMDEHSSTHLARRALLGPFVVGREDGRPMVLRGFRYFLPAQAFNQIKEGRP